MKIRATVAALTLSVAVGCAPAERESAAAPPAASGQAAVQDNDSQKDIVKVAVGSPDHSTLVAALKAAELVDVLANPGPFTAFAPVNAAFDKLPAGTVDELLKPENKSKLAGILRHHVTTSAWEVADLSDGMTLSMADGSSATISRKGEDVFIDGAKIVASVRASNGMVHVIDAVVLPGSAK